MGRHILVWLAIFFVGLFLVPIVLPPEAARARLDTELEAARAIFGLEQANTIVARANSAHQLVIVDTGLQGVVLNQYTTERDIRNQPVGQDTQRRIGSAFNRYLQTALVQVYAVFARLSVVFEWLLYVGLFLVAVVVDGITQRHKKFASGEDIETVKYALGGHVVIACIGLPFIYLIYPFYVSPWFVPVWVLLISAPMTLAIRNMAGLR